MQKKEKQYYLISLGEPLMRLSPPHFGQLRRAHSLDVYVVGSQLNVAANLARLGKKTAFVTQLPSGPLGSLAIDAFRAKNYFLAMQYFNKILIKDPTHKEAIFFKKRLLTRLHEQKKDLI